MKRDAFQSPLGFSPAASRNFEHGDKGGSMSTQVCAGQGGQKPARECGPDSADAAYKTVHSIQAARTYL